MKFSIENYYQQYLDAVNMPEKMMGSDIQRIEMRKTFFGAFGMALIVLRDQVSELSEEEGVEVMQDLLDQVDKFFKGQIEALKRHK